MPKAPRAQQVGIDVGESIGRVSGLWLAPVGARALFVFAHGAGAGMTHPFMETAAAELAARGVATLRYQFPYMEHGKRAPSARFVLLATVRAAVAEAFRRARGRPVFAGGKSMGGRMTSLAAAQGAGLAGLSGIAFLGFPLRAPRAATPGSDRAEHLRGLALPLLFVQGTRDPLAPLDEIEAVSAALGARASLHVVEGGDHSFSVLVRSGRTNDEALCEVADALAAWTEVSSSASPQRRKRNER